MNPAFSVIIFTTVAGAAQGMVVTLALALLAGMQIAPGFASMALIVAEAMLLIGLGASFAHLGRPERAWRAALMWRTSWLSREVIVLPAFIGVVALWWFALRNGVQTPLLPLAAIVVAALLWYCTGMIYACLRFIQEWAQPLTIVNFTLLGLSSGLILTSALAALWGEVALLRISAPCALVVTLVAWGTRMLALRHNATLKHRSTLQSATGIQATRLVQKSMGMSAGSFNTREFFHGASRAALGQIKLGFIVLGFVLPALLLLWGIAGASTLAFVLALLVQVPGLVADRWFFFAQAKHPQNLYYQVVS
ncbi:MAG: dimethyl sulfoxide reductase anchor subunit [Gammaproteobacteria bacterium]|nr:dimethyl sulfoxide reductase anchor subunit [Gammaproteobacteria bacterium]MBU1440923.1 dimethyl sulfoxide reductase anchor subunit [Gammaproteobacteria bacterium]MBU2289148.1 dimethyl sulfoxide reductase anchor subunit [Gammaproteobacteria bacterium]MBU2409249.1 dimethyl sulfoxide reductase anchor subunit [Gammaproteobacteria bacterium]